MSDKVRIYTNHHEYELVSLEELPVKTRGDFDYIEGEERYTPRFVIYKGNAVDVFEMETIPWAWAWAKSWSGYSSDSFFSGILVKFSPDGDTVQMGTFIA